MTPVLTYDLKRVKNGSNVVMPNMLILYCIDVLVDREFFISPISTLRKYLEGSILV